MLEPLFDRRPFQRVIYCIAIDRPMPSEFCGNTVVRRAGIEGMLAMPFIHIWWKFVDRHNDSDDGDEEDDYDDDDDDDHDEDHESNEQSSTQPNGYSAHELLQQSK